ncbi:MAG: pilus assembly protein [Bacilli bacterium]|nr:pilus assembly protein [Bacilli bacterium]
MNKNGQALVEFVLVLPILIFILLFIVDMGRLMIMKTHLESLLTSVNASTTTIVDKEYNISVEKQDNFIILKTCTNTYTPGLSKIIGTPACVEASKNIEE